MNEAYIALGSNISPRNHYLKQAIAALKTADFISTLQQSTIYETKPIGYEDQNNFLNQVVKVSTPLSALELLTACQAIELQLGRKRDVKWGPRTLDLDILLYNQENVMIEQLIIPHPRMHERAFVLIPLAELDPNIIIPTINRTVEEQLTRMSNQEKRGVIEWIKKDGEEG